MRYHSSLFYSNAGPTGLRLVVGEDDPRQAVKCYQAGDFVSEAEAQRRGIYEILIGESEPGATVSPAAVDVEAKSQKGAQRSRDIRTWGFERRAFTTPSIEERSYVENAVGTATPVTPAERAAAGEMGAEMTGPTFPEVAEAGSYEAATDRAAAAQQQRTAPSSPGGREPRTPPPPPARTDDPGRPS